MENTDAAWIAAICAGAGSILGVVAKAIYDAWDKRRQGQIELGRFDQELCDQEQEREHKSQKFALRVYENQIRQLEELHQSQLRQVEERYQYQQRQFDERYTKQQEQIDQLTSKYLDVQAKYVLLQNGYALLQSEHAECKRENVLLNARVDELERKYEAKTSDR